MRKIFLIHLVLMTMISWGQVGVHTDTPDNSSAMDIVAGNRGLLIPRVVLTSNLTSPSPVTAPAIGLLIFNQGPNQAMGFYYWNGSAWTLIGGGGSGGGSDWTLTGNAGTIPGTNFLGTTDNNHLLIYTNNTHRMRFENDGQIIIGGTNPNNTTDLFTVFGNSTQNAAINAYSPRTGFQTNGGRYGMLTTVDTANGFSVYGRNLDPLGYATVFAGSGYTTVGLIASHTAGVHSQGYDGLHAWGKDAAGYGIFAIGANAATPFNLSGVAAGISAIGSYGIIAKGNTATGRGIVAVGSNYASPSTTLESEGGAFVGFHGIYGRGTGYQTTPTLIAGAGVIGVGYNYSSYSSPSGGLSAGGNFSGDYGVYGKGLNAEGVGILGLGSNGAGYYTVTNGSGGAFTGYHGSLNVGTNTTSGIGVIGAGNNGVYTMLPSFGAGASLTGTTIGVAGFGTSASGGIGVIGSGNAAGALYPSNGAGGSFTGSTGSYSKSTASNGTGIIGLGNNIATPGAFASGSGGTFTGNAAGAVGWGVTAATGTGIIGAGNNIATPLTYGSGSGGAFTGTAAGVVGYGTTAASGVGVIGAGNNVSPTIPASNGCGGAFTGTVCGVYGNATTSSGVRYGGYFATTNGQYAYIGGRNGTTNQKVQGTGSVSTIVKNTKGERITLTCPEAPEVLFQDFGIGQLVNGFAHIAIDPDLSINIQVSEKHPLKVFVTPEGDCKGLYVTNKSAEGFDVYELQGGQSSVSFSWQIVATRANEEFVLRDGTIEISDYSQRFQPAPGPMEFEEQVPLANPIIPVETRSLEVRMSDKETYWKPVDLESGTLKVKSQEKMKNIGYDD